MSSPENPLALAHWRRSVAEMYAAVRQAPEAERESVLRAFRAERDRLFKWHLQSPLEPQQRAAFANLPYYPYDPAWRVMARIEAMPEEAVRPIVLAGDGLLQTALIGYAVFAIARLGIYWIQGYGGGVFIPFADPTNGTTTYAGGRYLYDTIKGADLGACEDEIVLDFNYAYNPSCAYSPRWVCPLPPPESRLPFAVEAGEMIFRITES